MIPIIKVYKKYKQVFLYIFFGICTTLVNTILYEFLYKQIHISNIASTVIAWFAAVAFAYITNKKFVFDSKPKGSKNKFNQIISFVACRGGTGILDVVIMVVAVDYMKLNSFVCKLISNIIVTIINYVASKFFIFKKSVDEADI